MDELNEQVWGVRFNEQNFCKFDLEASEWVKACEDNSAWYSEGWSFGMRDKKSWLVCTCGPQCACWII